MQYNFNIPKEGEFIINSLYEAGFEAYVVGGFIRDRILGLDVSDVDIATDALPDYIERIFSDYKTIDVGKVFGTISIVIGEQTFEVTTFRIDGNYIDGRRPEKVEFSRTLKEDLRRRDFTINAMAYNERVGLVDYFGGYRDLNESLLKTVGPAEKRISEDYLRMLRAIRFAAKYNLSISPKLSDSIRKHSKEIENISAERISKELNKMLLGDRPSLAFDLLYDHGLLEYIFEDLYKAHGFDQMTIHHDLDVYGHTMKVLDNTPKDLDVRLAAIFHDLGKIYTRFIGEDGNGHFYGHEKVSEDICRRELKRLRYDGKTIDTVSALVNRHMDAMNPYTEKRVNRLVRKMGVENLRKLFYLQKADILATNNPEFAFKIDEATCILDDIIEKNKVVFVNQIAIDGDDIIELGYKQGKVIGLILNHITELVADGELINDRQIILKYIRERSYKDEEDNNCRFMFGT